MKKVHILEFGTFSSFFDPGNIPMKIRRLLYPFKKYFGDTLTDNIIPFKVMSFNKVHSFHHL